MSKLDYRAIRQRIPMRRVLELLRYEPSVRRGDQWRGPCPLCSTSSDRAADPCFSVHVARGLFQCFRCGRSGNQLDLWVQLSGLPLYPAALDLCGHLGIAPAVLAKPQPKNCA